MLVSASPSLFPFVSIFLPFSSFRCSFPLLSRAVFRIKEGLNVKLSIHWFSKKIRKYTNRMFPFVDSFAVRRDNHFDFTTARSDPIQSDPIRSKEINKFDHLDRKSADRMQGLRGESTIYTRLVFDEPNRMIWERGEGGGGGERGEE